MSEIEVPAAIVADGLVECDFLEEFTIPAVSKVRISAPYERDGAWYVTMTVDAADPAP